MWTDELVIHPVVSRLEKTKSIKFNNTFFQFFFLHNLVLYMLIQKASTVIRSIR